MGNMFGGNSIVCTISIENISEEDCRQELLDLALKGLSDLGYTAHGEIDDVTILKDALPIFESGHLEKMEQIRERYPNMVGNFLG